MHCWKQTSYLSWTYCVLVLVSLHCITLLDHGSLSCHKMRWPSKYYQPGFCVRSKQYTCLLSRGIYGRRSCRQRLWKRLNTCQMHGSWHRLAPSLLSLFSKPGGPWSVLSETLPDATEGAGNLAGLYSNCVALGDMSLNGDKVTKSQPRWPLGVLFGDSCNRGWRGVC